MCFSGHRELAQREQMLSGRLDLLLEQLYERGYRRFFNGAALGFDQLAAEQVLQLKQRHQDVKLIMAVPCETQGSRWEEGQIRHYETLLAHADETRVLARHYYNGCMNVRNRHMVYRSSLCVCFLDKPKGGTMSTVAYAVSSGLDVINLADDTQWRQFCSGQAEHDHTSRS